MKNVATHRERNSRGTRSREIILSTAREVFSELGPEAATMRHIARRSGVNIATLLYYFPDKESLVVEVMGKQERAELQILREWRDSLTDQQLSNIDSLKEALNVGGIMIIDRIIEDPSRFRLDLYSDLDATKFRMDDTLESRESAVEKPDAGIGHSQDSPRPETPEKEVTRAVLLRAIELGTLHCEMQDLDDYIDGYSYLCRGFAIAHMQEIAPGAKNRDKVVNRFRKLVHRYIYNMLPGE
jgi:AcrR family transcriptional regulator